MQQKSIGSMIEVTVNIVQQRWLYPCMNGTGTVVFLYAIHHTCLMINVPLNTYREIDKYLHNASVRNIRIGIWIFFITCKAKAAKVNDIKSDKNLLMLIAFFRIRLEIIFLRKTQIFLSKEFLSYLKLKKNGF